MKLLRYLCVMSLFGSTAFAAMPQLSSLTVRLTPRNSGGGGCPMKSADGGALTSAYSTAAAENFAFPFDDPLPPDVVLSHLQVTISMLAACADSNPLQLRLNRDIPDLDEQWSKFSPPAQPLSHLTSCNTAAPFRPVTVYNQSVIPPLVRPYRRGEQNVINVEEVAGGACGDVLIEYLDVTFSFWTNVPRITFEVTNATPEDHRKVLMHRYRADYDYLSPWQAAVPGTDAAKDNRVLVRGRATHADGSAYANETINLRVLDPPSPMPYMPAGTVKWFDNPYGWSNFLKDKDFLSLWQTYVTDNTGKFEAVLPTARYLAGDNQVVEASALPLPLYLYAKGECKESDACYRSGTFTAWRRVYIEADRMFREGAFLLADVPAGSSEISVDNARPWRNASVTNPIPITLIHAADGAMLPPGNSFYMEDRKVIRARGGKRGVLQLDAPVSRDYVVRASITRRNEAAGDAVGRTDRGTYEVETGLAVDFLKSAFVDYQVLPDKTKNVIPYVPWVEKCPSMQYCTEIASIWFENKDAPNHQHLVSATVNTDSEAGHAVLGQFGAFGNAAFIWRGKIEALVADSGNTQYGGSDLKKVIAEITVHELVHLYDVNPPALESDDPAVFATGGHCNSLAWDGGHCLMNVNRTRAERTDGVVSLHVRPGFVSTLGATMEFGDSEFRRIRYRLDPLPQVYQTNRDSY